MRGAGRYTKPISSRENSVRVFVSKQLNLNNVIEMIFKFSTIAQPTIRVVAEHQMDDSFFARDVETSLVNKE